MITESPQLRLHVVDEYHPESANPARSLLSEIPAIERLIELFPQITGWELDCQAAHHQQQETWTEKFLSGETSIGSNSSSRVFVPHLTHQPKPPVPAELSIVDMSADLPAGRSCASRQKCDVLVEVFNELVAQVQSAHQHIEVLNAQIATAIPLTTTDDDGQILWQRLRGVIQQGLSALNLTAGGLYLLDDDTRELHLRVHVGLSTDSLLRGPRPLKHSLADLEALVGHSLTISGPEQSEKWRPPEDFAASLCVPVATHSNPLGTLWLFAKHARPFSGSDVAMAEIIGGRLASELEREAAVREGAVARKLGRDFDRAQLWQQLQSPPMPPRIDGWQVIGNQILNQGVGGALFDLVVLPAGKLVASAGDVQGAVFESGLAAATLRGAMRTLAARNLTPEELLYEVNNTLWNCPLGDQIGSLFQIAIEPATGIARWSNAGETGAVILGAGSEPRIVEASTPLGICPDERFEFRERVLLPQSTLFAFNEGFRSLFKYSFRHSNDEDIIERMHQESLLEPARISRWVDDLVAGFDSYRSTPDISFIAIHRSLDQA